MILHCLKAIPYEACGLLSGNPLTGNTLWKMENEANKLNRFYMSSESIRKAAEKIAEKGEELSGIFHSHPTSPPIPSSFDRKNNPYPNLAYIIVSFYKGELDVGCFRIENEEKVVPIELVIIEE